MKTVVWFQRPRSWTSCFEQKNQSSGEKEVAGMQVYFWKLVNHWNWDTEQNELPNLIRSQRNQMYPNQWLVLISTLGLSGRFNHRRYKIYPVHMMTFTFKTGKMIFFLRGIFENLKYHLNTSSQTTISKGIIKYLLLIIFCFLSYYGMLLMIYHWGWILSI